MNKVLHLSMFKKFTYLMFVCLGLFAASCKKEVVKPCNPANPMDSAIMEHRDGETGSGGTTSGGGSTDPGGNTTTQDSTITTVEGTDEGGGITDGGNSSEHDSKGKRKKTN